MWWRLCVEWSDDSSKFPQIDRTAPPAEKQIAGAVRVDCSGSRFCAGNPDCLSREFERLQLAKCEVDIEQQTVRKSVAFRVWARSERQTESVASARGITHVRE